MLLEFLRPEKIVLGLHGSSEQAMEQLFSRSSFLDRTEEVRAALKTEGLQRYSLMGQNIYLPHVRLENLESPEIILGLSPSGIRFKEADIKIIFFLATPAAFVAQHLQLLQRISAILSSKKEALLAARDAGQIIKVIAEGEQESGLATFFNLTQDQVAFELQTDLEQGLGSTEVLRRQAIYGSNVLKRGRHTSWTLKLFRNLFSFFAVLLWMAAGLCFVPGVDMPQLGLAIISVVFVNGLFAFFQEQKSDKAVEKLGSLMSHSCRVIRGGVASVIDATQLVPGDLILLDEGDMVPADARLIEAFEVEVDNSALTGESNPARRYKSDQPLLLKGKFLWIELPNIIFAGTSFLKGHARAVVFGTGMNSEIGKIAKLTQNVPAEPSPLQKQLHSTVWAIAGLASVFGLGFLLFGWLLSGLSFLQAFVFFIGLFVANVPEGLLPTVTLALAMGVTRMAKRHALVKNLPSVETLGCTTVICSDKTGTLTQNQMMVNWVYVDEKAIQVTGTGYEPRGEFFRDERVVMKEEIVSPAFERMLECAFVCNNARLRTTPEGTSLVGDPTEGALLVLVGKAGLNPSFKRVHVNPFESIRKRMSVVTEAEKGGLKKVYVKGAPDEVLERCDHIYSSGTIRSLNEDSRRQIKEQIDHWASSGFRLLAFSFRDDEAIQNAGAYGIDDVEKNLVFTGLVAIADPVRPEVFPAIQACHKAGIRVIMITGDYPLTASSIGRTIGLGEGGNLRVVTGVELADMDDRDLKAILKSAESIFARVIPEHKLRIVSLLEEMGEIVAVTGDGANDAPALKRARIGIAMGRRGHEVAREAAHMILTDDNFGSIVSAIEEGRAIFENIRRFMAYIFSSNPQEFYPYIFWILFPELPLAMTVMGVLAVDVGTDLIPAMGLGIEPPEGDVMERPPRRPTQKLLSLPFILRHYLVQGSLLAFSCYATYYYMGWILGSWSPWLPLTSMPSSPPDLNFKTASFPYLQTLTAYFFPTVTTQIANVMCRRSWKTSLFSKQFLSPARRELVLDSIKKSKWAWASSFLKRHPILLNFISNPLIDLGIIFEFILCWVFFYTPLSRLYFFAPVPWHVYLFALHGTVLLFIFEETKKYFRRRGYALEFLG